MDAGIDFLRAGQLADDVTRLGHAQDAPRAIARDPPVLPAGMVDTGGHRDDRAAAPVLAEERSDRFLGDQRLIGEEHNDLGDLGRDRTERRADRVARAELLLLHREDQPIAPIEVRLELLGVMADHDDRLRGRATLRRLEHGVDHRAAGDGVEELREARMHPLPLPGGEDNGGTATLCLRGRWRLVGIRRRCGAQRGFGFGRHRALPDSSIIAGHSDPSHAFCWRRINDWQRGVAGVPGFEPGTKAPKAPVLPLHHTPIADTTDQGRPVAAKYTTPYAGNGSAR